MDGKGQVRGQLGLKVGLGVGVLVAVAFSFILPRVRETNLASPGGPGTCRFPAIYNFGDSNSDTGGRSAVFYRIPSPYGETFFGKASGRFSDGRLIIDLVAEMLGLPSVSAYLDSVGSDFRHGANFAMGGSTIQPVNGRLFEARFSPISLEIQLSQFQQFKARARELHGKDVTSGIPNPEDFSKALYMMDIGQNDLWAGVTLATEDQLRASVPNITNRFASVVEQLYKEGARAFWIHNTGPIGCLPMSVMLNRQNPDNMDPIGCVKSQNEIAQEFNLQLKEKVSELRAKLVEARLTYVDIYSAKYVLIAEAEKHGFVDPLGYCCSRAGDAYIPCGMKTVVNGEEVYGSACSNLSQYISWDGIHYSHVANEWVAKKIEDGSFSDPPVPISRACHNL
ncbi:hypothetical protein CDL15_Pgr009770 [Punica granatum]|uniref:GDSL esterase/lipase At5g14450-like n=1 Tax=Punica granatum TaxID=22663 RepID=A0A218WTE9_PUNGR|nr:hypothetical protein CDL15_Pgr009770 [Punica granatum]